MNAPKAIEPKWYLKTQYTPLEIDPEPLESEVLEKYQITQVADMIN